MLNIFSIYDKKAVQYHQPFYAGNKGLALRMFQEIVEDQKTSISKYPADFSIWILGDYNEQTGEIHPKKMPEFLDEACNFVSRKNLESNNGA